jgi:hypothetical protein
MGRADTTANGHLITRRSWVQIPPPLFSEAPAIAGVSSCGEDDCSGSAGAVLARAARVNSLALADRGSILVSDDADWNVIAWDVRTGRPFGSSRVHDQGVVNGVAVSPTAERSHLLALKSS